MWYTIRAHHLVVLGSMAQLRRPIFLVVLGLLLYTLPQVYVHGGRTYIDNHSAPGVVADPGNASSIACTLPPSTLVLAEYQAWHGLDSHQKPPPYNSDDPAVIERHIKAAKERCIDGFVVNWYGPPDGVGNDIDRTLIDDVIQKLLQQAAGQDFAIGLMYDEGTVLPPRPAMEQVMRDLQYAKRYFTMPAYLKIGGRPALFLFPYETVDPLIDWGEVRLQLNTPLTFIDKDPNPGHPAHDAHFDGFYAWVQPSTPPGWDEGGSEWGEGYLRWFYQTMRTLYQSKVLVGGVWPGFDDSLASWGQNRYISPRCGQTWHDTWSLVAEYDPSVVMINTWNDFEEGTAVEYDIGTCLAVPPGRGVQPGSRIAYQLTLTNTGKFTDTFTVQTASSHQWEATLSSSSVHAPPGSTQILTVTLTAPANTPIDTQDLLLVTTTSGLSSTVYNTAAITTTVHPFRVYLPVIDVQRYNRSS